MFIQVLSLILGPYGTLNKHSMNNKYLEFYLGVVKSPVDPTFNTLARMYHLSDGFHNWSTLSALGVLERRMSKYENIHSLLVGEIDIPNQSFNDRRIGIKRKLILIPTHFYNECLTWRFKCSKDQFANPIKTRIYTIIAFPLPLCCDWKHGRRNFGHCVFYCKFAVISIMKHIRQFSIIWINNNSWMSFLSTHSHMYQSPGGFRI